MIKQEFESGWTHFCSRINFGDSPLDAEAIRFMNEMPSKIGQTLKQRDDLLAALEDWINCAYNHDITCWCGRMKAEQAIAKVESGEQTRELTDTERLEIAVDLLFERELIEYAGECKRRENIPEQI